MRRSLALAAQAADLLDEDLGRVEQGLNLVVGQCAPPRIPLVVGDMWGRVPFVQDLRRYLAEQVLAVLRPAVAGIDEVFG